MVEEDFGDDELVLLVALLADEKLVEGKSCKRR